MGDTAIESIGNGNGGGGGNDNPFLASLPEDIRGEASLSVFKDVGGVAKGFVETKKLVTKKDEELKALSNETAWLKKPEDETKLDEWKKGSTAKLRELGILDAVPESPDKYEFSFKDADGKDIVDAETIKNDPVLKEFASLAHEEGLTMAQAQKFVDRFHEKMLPMLFVPSAAPSKEETVQTLTKEWGDKLNENATLARKAVKSINTILPGFSDWNDSRNGYMGNDPMWIKTMTVIGGLMSQDSSAGAGERNTGETLETLDEKIAALSAQRDTMPPNVYKRKWNELYTQKSIIADSLEAKRR